jgi:hypothetical protein
VARPGNAEPDSVVGVIEDFLLRIPGIQYELIAAGVDLVTEVGGPAIVIRRQTAVIELYRLHLGVQ